MRIRRWYGAVASVVALATAGAGTARIAYGNADRNDDERERRNGVVVRERFTDVQQEPLALSTTGTGWFVLGIDERDRELTYRPGYGRRQGKVTRAHLHVDVWRRGGGVSPFPCSNLGNGPAGPSRVRWHRP
ncbi:hypothetical protein ACN27G_13665 [Plantactinospora sp. WMMB334]|uniref:hypothetical protein n=1 Tax=Plantactinospora sp. WMMB334 TaxID=3404119 RepID=UPI003B955864